MGHNHVASSIPKVKQEKCRESLSVYKCGVSHDVCHLVKHFSPVRRSQLSRAKATCGRENAIRQYKLSWKHLEPVPCLFISWYTQTYVSLANLSGCFQSRSRKVCSSHLYQGIVPCKGLGVR